MRIKIMHNLSFKRDLLKQAP